MFRNRTHAGHLLGTAMQDAAWRAPVVLGLPRGGVVVAEGVADALGAPMDVVVVRKLGAPGNPELGIGAVAEGKVTVLNEHLIDRLSVTEDELAAVTIREHAELDRRRAAYRPTEPLDLEGRDAIVVDDGLATGYTARAAIASVRLRTPARVILAVPVAAVDTAREMVELIDELVCLEALTGMLGVGASYRDFRQTTDDEVRRILGK